ncbi:tetratricopeptide repeat protein [Methanobacterium sp. SMA-27]|uniref:tetratricopeptide repeat protein n=1 Tax=Methanobacterium sp. SMA-27 TaxID=1495336 RepID=UPI00064ED95A|nr:tetratricopeptide repeat protein [Methanobacterium sp. SMA-27]
MAVFDKLKNRNNDKLINECYEFIERLEYEHALKCLDRVLKLEPENIEILHNKGVVLKELGKLELKVQTTEYLNP